MSSINLIESKSESKYHKVVKNYCFKQLVAHYNAIQEKSLEKVFGSRRADIYLKLHSGEEIVVEIQNSRLSPREIIHRTQDYNSSGIYVLWILNGRGEIVADPKEPRDAWNLKISPAENLLHSMYGGRVYYINLNQYLHKTTLTPPFALHFSLPNKKSPKIHKHGYSYYYIRNANAVRVPNWSIVAAQYSFKIARFYDKHFKSVLKPKIRSHLRTFAKKSCENCNKHFKWIRRCTLDRNCRYKKPTRSFLLKQITSYYSKLYGKDILAQCIKDLLHDEKFWNTL